MRPSEAVAQSDCFVFGSLAARNQGTRDTLYELIKHAPFKVFDVNLREPYYTKEIVENLLHQADMVKMNAHELAHDYRLARHPDGRKDRHQKPVRSLRRTDRLRDARGQRSNSVERTENFLKARDLRYR